MYRQADEQTVRWLNDVRKGSDTEAYEALRELCLRCSRSLVAGEESGAESAAAEQLQAGSVGGGGDGSDGGSPGGSEAGGSEAGSSTRSGRRATAGRTLLGATAAGGAAADVPPHRLFGTNAEVDALNKAQQKMLDGKQVSGNYAYGRQAGTGTGA